MVVMRLPGLTSDLLQRERPIAPDFLESGQPGSDTALEIIEE
jgi:hypothetical protein